MVHLKMKIGPNLFAFLSSVGQKFLSDFQLSIQVYAMGSKVVLVHNIYIMVCFLQNKSRTVLEQRSK